MSEPYSAKPNPYAPPAVPGPAAEESVPEPKRVYRWRLIPTVLCLLIALPFLLMVVGAAVILTTGEEPVDFALEIMIMGGYGLTGFGVAVVAATSWWKKRWIRAICFTLLIVLYLVGGPPVVEWLLSQVRPV